MFSSMSELTGPNTMARSTKSLEKNIEIHFFAKMAAKNYFRVPVFCQILVLHLRLGRFSQKSQKFSGTLF